MMSELLSRGALVCACLLLVSCMQAEAQNCSIISRQWNSASSFLITRSPTADRCEQFLFGTNLYKGIHTIKIEGYIMECSASYPDSHNVLVFSSNMTLLHDFCKEAKKNNTNTTTISTTDYSVIVQQRSRKNNLVFTRISYSFQFAPPNASNSTNTTTLNSTTPALYGCGLPPPRPLVSNIRIIGGQNAPNNTWPWMAFYGCGGAFISDRWILTVAHCLYQAGNNTNQTNQTSQTNQTNLLSGLRIYAGGNDLNNMPNSFTVSKVVLHQNYNPNTNHDDIALIQLDKPVMFSNNIQPICLPPYDLNRVDRQVILTGWGAINVTTSNNVTNYTETNLLHQVTIPIRNIADCVSSLGMNLDPSTQICAGVYNTNPNLIRSACNGDSGSPVVFQFGNEYYIAGLTSDGDASCNGNGYFTNVWPYMNWIRNTMENS